MNIFIKNLTNNNSFNLATILQLLAINNRHQVVFPRKLSNFDQLKNVLNFAPFYLFLSSLIEYSETVSDTKPRPKGNTNNTK